MPLRVCIPTAGTGSRLGPLTQFLNKSLVSLANRPILSHLIEQFPDDTEFVIALGHKGWLVREFLELAYPDRTFFYADVSPFEGIGSGLGHSLLQCREHLQQPFIFLSCDTLVRGAIPDLKQNWMGYAEIDDISPYRTLNIQNLRVEDICEKGIGTPSTHKPYIGFAGIADYQVFWNAMESGGQQAIDSGESHGLRALLPKGIKPIPFTWYDTGNPQALEKARAVYQQAGAPNILDKANEAIWFIGDNVVKFSDDTSFIANRASRAAEIAEFVPTITAVRPHMYRYPKATGHVLSEVVTLPIFEKLLNHCQNFWKLEPLSGNDKDAFKKRCMSFYKDKTLDRVALFYKNFERQDGKETINDASLPLLKHLLDKLDWDWIADGLAGRFHGDLHFENILWSDKSRSFTFLDWRQDFGGSLTTGDIYYDLAKLMHGLIICHELIAKDQYWVKWEAQTIHYDFHRKQILVECEKFFEAWLADHGYDVKKVRVLTALIYLNIAALHHYPYSLLLYTLGKSMLSKEVEI